MFRSIEADKHFGAIVEQMRSRLAALRSKRLPLSVQGKLAQVLNNLTQCKEDFNKIIQLKTEQCLHRTRLETSYRSLASFVLGSNRADLLDQPGCQGCHLGCQLKSILLGKFFRSTHEILIKPNILSQETELF